MSHCNGSWLILQCLPNSNVALKHGCSSNKSEQWAEKQIKGYVLLNSQSNLKSTSGNSTSGCPWQGKDGPRQLLASSKLQNFFCIASTASCPGKQWHCLEKQNLNCLLPNSCLRQSSSGDLGRSQLHTVVPSNGGVNSLSSREGIPL